MVTVVAVGALLASSWVAVYAGGGTQAEWPHVFYIPVIIATVPFGVAGAVATAAVATVLCGPLMPLNVAEGIAQDPANWLTRGAFFLAVGLVSAAAQQVLQSTVRQSVTGQLERELLQSGEPDDAGGASEEDRLRVHAVLRGGTFHPVYQPVYALDDGRLVAVEALTRFDVQPTEPPDVWFARASAAGLGAELELAAIDDALAGARDLSRSVRVNVNCSPAVLVDRRLPPLIDRYRKDRDIQVELTEHATVDDYTALVESLDLLRSRDVTVAVDDAGAGFASLRHIVRIAPDAIKLDVSLTQNLRHDPVRRALADVLVQFAHRTGTAMIAEGIEEEQDLAVWRDLGAHAAQGYLLGRPGTLLVDEYCELLTDRSSVSRWRRAS